jgi:hypothetical protein
LTEFLDEFPESVRRRGVAGFVCEGKWYLLSDLPHLDGKIEDDVRKT